MKKVNWWNLPRDNSTSSLRFDRNLEYQQNFAGLTLAVLVIHAPSNDVAVLRPLMPAALTAIHAAKPGNGDTYPCQRLAVSTSAEFGPSSARKECYEHR